MRYKLVDMQEVVATQAEKVLLAWVIDLVKERSKPVYKVLRNIYSPLATSGYTLWVTVSYKVGRQMILKSYMKKSLILKKSKLKNKDIAYSAKLLKRLHNFGMEKFGFVEAEIPESYLHAVCTCRVDFAQPIPTYLMANPSLD